MVFIDSNAFVVLVIGLMNPNWLKDNPKTSIYNEQDFNNLMHIIGTNKILTTPNILTEVDNLLNKFSGHKKYPYIKTMMDIVKNTTEKYISSVDVVSNYHFQNLGLTDSIILHLRNEYKFLITADSDLSDHAFSLGIPVLDLVAYRNSRFQE